MQLKTTEKIIMIFYYLSKRAKKKFSMFWKEWGLTFEEIEMFLSVCSIFFSLFCLDIFLSIF